MSKNNILHLFLKGIFLNTEILCYYYYYFVLRMYCSAVFQVSNRKLSLFFFTSVTKVPFSLSCWCYIVSVSVGLSNVIMTSLDIT